MKLLLLLLACLVFASPAYADQDGAGSSMSDGIDSVDPSGGLNRDTRTSTLEHSLCQIILFVNGRIGRAIAAMSLMLIAYQFLLGKAQWGVVAVTCVGLGMMFGAKSVALALLPSRVYTKNYDTDEYEVKSSEEIIRRACPALR